jgi:hypothetical protein
MCAKYSEILGTIAHRFCQAQRPIQPEENEPPQERFVEMNFIQYNYKQVSSCKHGLREKVPATSW